ncbi:hypothetical protein OH77DRAFT_1522272 [Trametes cingulata]|nr:hypothetical protein OH77DRAFT_1522272 [Trametes cingulata]
MSLLLPNGQRVNLNSPALFPRLPSLDGTYGALLVGTFISAILYGMTLHQVYRYLRTCPSRSPARYYVLGLLFLDTFHTVLCMHACYWYLISNYYKPLQLTKGVWSVDLLPVAVGCTIITCQCFYARRVYLIERKYKYVVVFVILLFLAVLGCAVAATAEAFILPNYSDFSRVTWLTSAGFGIVVVADALLTGVLMFTLHRLRTGHQRTDSVIDVLILYALCTGLLTDILSVLAFCFGLFLPHKLVYVAIDNVTAKVYVNSVLAALNFRHSFSHDSISHGPTAALSGIFKRSRTPAWSPMLKAGRSTLGAGLRTVVPCMPKRPAASHTSTARDAPRLSLQLPDDASVLHMRPEAYVRAAGSESQC